MLGPYSPKEKIVVVKSYKITKQEKIAIDQKRKRLNPNAAF